MLWAYPLPSSAYSCFIFQTDDQLRQAVSPFLELITFRRIALEGEESFHFQSMVLRRPTETTMQCSTRVVAK